MTQVFLSWSGNASREVATALNRWLPVMLNSIEPFISTDDLRKGGRWASDLADRLEQATFAVLCITPDNLQAPWLMFEAGAVSKLIAKSQVAPFLYKTKPSDLQGPLAQFNATLNEKEDFFKLLKGINQASSSTVKEDTLSRAFDISWPNFQADLEKIKVPSDIPSKSTPSNGAASSDLMTVIDPILQEILSHSRQQTQVLSSPLFSGLIERARVRTGSDVPPKGHKVWEDLILMFEDLVLTALAVDQSIDQLNLLKAVEKISSPIEYLSNKMAADRLTERSFKEMIMHLRKEIVEVDKKFGPKDERIETGKAFVR